MYSRITIHTYSIKIGYEFTQAFRKSSKIALEDWMILIEKVNQLFQKGECCQYQWTSMMN